MFNGWILEHAKQEKGVKWGLKFESKCCRLPLHLTIIAYLLDAVCLGRFFHARMEEVKWRRPHYNDGYQSGCAPFCGFRRPWWQRGGTLLRAPHAQAAQGKWRLLEKKLRGSFAHCLPQDWHATHLQGRQNWAVKNRKRSECVRRNELWIDRFPRRMYGKCGPNYAIKYNLRKFRWFSQCALWKQSSCRDESRSQTWQSRRKVADRCRRWPCCRWKGKWKSGCK